MRYSATLERGADGSYLAWVHELPGCSVRARTREDVEARLPATVAEFLAWAGEPQDASVEVEVEAEIESAIDADEDTEVLVEPDREPLTDASWARVERWARRSRAELLDLLGRFEDLEQRPPGRERTIREELAHVGFVELMYVAWTFDVRSADGLAQFLAWTRSVALERMRDLAREDGGRLTWAEWSGAPRPEPWTARKAARRLVWHELLHVRALRDVAAG